MSKGKVLKFDSVSRVKNKAKQAKGRQKVFLLLLLAALLALGILLVRSEVQIHKLQSEKHMEEERQSTLIRTKEDLQAELESINTDEYIERLARRDLQLIKPNELLFVLPEVHKYTAEDIIVDDTEANENEPQSNAAKKSNSVKEEAALEQGEEDGGSSTEN